MIPLNQLEVGHDITFENRATDFAPLPDSELLDVHHQFAPTLAWLEVFDRMRHTRDSAYDSKSQDSAGVAQEVPMKRGWVQKYIQPASRGFQYLWMRLPVFLRAFAYKRLASLGLRLYGSTGSYSTYRLPFSLYLRIGRRDWAPKHEAELQSL